MSKKRNYNKGRIECPRRKTRKYLLTNQDIQCLISAISLAFVGITTMIQNDLLINPFAIITYGMITFSFASMIVLLSFQKRDK